MPVKQYVPIEVADALVEALKPFAGYHCDPLGDCDGRTSDKMCFNCEAQKQIANYNKFKQGE